MTVTTPLRAFVAAAMLALLCASCTLQGATTDATDTQPVVDALAAGASTPDLSCRVASDCDVKNVGNCCGYFPACVNKDSPVDPEAVRAECARTGNSSVCGWKDIQACDCVAGQCSAVTGPLKVQG
jgi:hypothetical protein